MSEKKEKTGNFAIIDKLFLFFFLYSFLNCVLEKRFCGCIGDESFARLESTS
jgi:hypothetical protein